MFVEDETEVREERKEDVLKLSGDVDIHHLEAFHNALKERYPLERDLVLDCTDLVQMDTAGIQLLLAFKKSLPPGRRLTVRNLSSYLEEALDMMGVKQVLLR
ncbi:MAG: STAS domain-containing protein [Pseudomonadota bacterium]